MKRRSRCDVHQTHVAHKDRRCLVRLQPPVQRCARGCSGRDFGKPGSLRLLGSKIDGGWRLPTRKVFRTPSMEGSRLVRQILAGWQKHQPWGLEALCPAAIHHVRDCF